MATVPVRTSTGGVERVILGPCAPCTATLAVLITSFVVSCVVDICKTPRPNLGVYLGFSVCSLGFLFHLVWYCFSIYSQISLWYLKLLLVSNGGKGQEKTCPCPRVGHSDEEEKASTWFLKSPKATNRNRSVSSTINTIKRV